MHGFSLLVRNIILNQGGSLGQKLNCFQQLLIELESNLKALLITQQRSEQLLLQFVFNQRATLLKTLVSKVDLVVLQETLKKP